MPLSRARSLDLALYRVLRTAGHTEAAEAAVRRFSLLGEHAAVWLAIGAAGAAADRPRRERWTRGLATVGGAYVVNTALKLIVRRRRPDVPGLPPLTGTPTGLSFPSAHATSSFAAARAYSALVPAAPLYALAGGLALSRLYLGVHYPSDALAGIALGTVIGSAGR
ncbi:MAG: phosphatase PAP2 family protein [Solirubrobacteraceae bacterium]